MKIVTDCAADMSAEELEQLGVTAAPLFIQFPEGEVNATEISADDFYNRLEAMRPAIPTTAQPSAGIFAELYRKLAEKDKDIFSIHISSGLSGTINSAHDGGEQVEPEANVSYWDTLTLSGGERFQVMAAALATQSRLGNGCNSGTLEENSRKDRGDLHAGYFGISCARRPHWTGKSTGRRIAQSQARHPRGYRWQVQHGRQWAHPEQVHER